MDPQAIMNNATPFNFTEIWPYQLGQSTEISNREDDDPMIVDRKAEERKRRQIDDSPANAASDSDISKRPKAASTKSKCSRGGEKGEGKVEMDGGKKDYIHVRARRGQATDSHSLAERARREKISERMKILQELVPGCNKVIGKALVLDEIINYIQSLQQQVEFLSMKLEAVNSRTGPSIDGFPSKDLQYGQHAFEMVGVTFDSQAPREFNRSSSPEWLHMQIGGNFERPT